MRGAEEGFARSEEPVVESDCCGPEEIFEFCEGMLEPARAREMRDHLRNCSRCRSFYEQEMSLSAALSSPEVREGEWPGESGGAQAGVSHRVAMALPTRSVAAKIMWGAGAAALLVMALISLALHAVQPFTFVTHFMGVCWGFISGVSDAAGIILTVSGSTILIALLVGAFMDVLIAATLVVAARWRWLRGV